MKRFSLAALFLALLLTLAWLAWRAGAIDPARHEAYLRNLRTLAEIEARIDAETLAAHYGLVRNFDHLARLSAVERDVAAALRNPPAFLSAAEQSRLATMVAQLEKELARKQDELERFKREFSALRNSLSWFPTAAHTLLATINDFSTYRETAHYVGRILIYGQHASDDNRIAAEEARARLLMRLRRQRLRTDIQNLIIHGDQILLRAPRVSRQVRSITTSLAADELQRLLLVYDEAYRHASERAAHYRRALALGALLLLVLLAQVLLRLKRARDELAQRYAEKVAAEKKLRLHATVFSSAQEGIAITDPHGAILDVNPAFTQITGYSREEAIGQNPRLLQSGRHDRAFYEAMWQSVRERGHWQGEIWNRNKRGEIYPEFLSITAVKDDGGALSHYVGIFSDISRIKAQQERLTYLAYHDELTGLPNRRLLTDRLTLACAQARRNGTRLAVCYLDLDGFKPINDRFGHEVGDSVLIALAERMAKSLRAGDSLARLGGDEFVVLLPGLAGWEECADILERLLQHIAEPILLASGRFSLTASIGVTLFPDDDSAPDILLRHADQAMYEAKQGGKNVFRLFDAEQDRFLRERQARISRLRQALANDEFVLYYQPKVDLRQGRVIGAEALIRWHSPEEGLLSPDAFLPLVEADELIVEIGHWTIATAIRQMHAWHRMGLSLPLSVNVTARQLQEADFAERLADMLAAAPEVASRLEIEVLESTALADLEQTSRIIATCREIGVSFALDDFGAGYSSLKYLRHLPAATIKIDQGFVRDCLDDADDLAIVEAVVGLAVAFQRNVIAEGVESADHARLLLQLGCDHAQGYGIARPMPAEAIPAWIAQWRPDPCWEEYRRRYLLPSDFLLLSAEVQHRAWLRKLLSALDENELPPRLPSLQANACHFSRWRRDPAVVFRHGHLPEYSRSMTLHERVHWLGERIDERLRAGDWHAASALQPELLAVHEAFLAALRELQLAASQFFS